MEPKIDEQSSSQPTLEVLDDLAKEITTCWEALGRKLGVEEATIEGIRINSVQHPGPRMKAFEMLKGWRTKGDSTYGKLVKTLKLMNMDCIAKKYCGADKGK